MPGHTRTPHGARVGERRWGVENGGKFIWPKVAVEGITFPFPFKFTHLSRHANRAREAVERNGGEGSGALPYQRALPSPGGPQRRTRPYPAKRPPSTLRPFTRFAIIAPILAQRAPLDNQRHPVPFPSPPFQEPPPLSLLGNTNNTCLLGTHRRRMHTNSLPTLPIIEHPRNNKKKSLSTMANSAPKVTGPTSPPQQKRRGVGDRRDWAWGRRRGAGSSGRRGSRGRGCGRGGR